MPRSDRDPRERNAETGGSTREGSWNQSVRHVDPHRWWEGATQSCGSKPDHIGETASPPEVHGSDHQISQLIVQRTDYFKAPASSFPTSAPPPLLTNDVRIGTALLTIS